MKKNEISFLNVIFCMMVIFIHVTAFPVTSLPPHNISLMALYAVQRICGVAVHGFVFLGGLKLFLKETSCIKYSTYLVSRLKKIYVPYLVIAVAYYLYEVCMGYMSFDFLKLSGFLVFGSGEAHLYFVFVIMQFYILFPLWRYLMSRVGTVWVLSVSAVVNIFFYCWFPKVLELCGICDNFSYNHGVFTSYLFAWILGCVCGKYYKKFLAFINEKFVILGFCALILACYDIYMAYNNYYYGTEFALLKPVRLLYLPAMILFLYGIAVRCSDKLLNSRAVLLIDSVSYEIYLFHIFVIYFVDKSITKYLNFGVLESYFLKSFAVYFISIYACIVFRKMFNKLIPR